MGGVCGPAVLLGDLGLGTLPAALLQLMAEDSALPVAEMTRGAALYFAFVGIYLLVGLIFLIFWRWLRRDPPLLSLAIFCFVMMVHSAAISGTLSALLEAVDTGTSALLQRISLLSLSGLIAWMLWAFFPHAFYPSARSRLHVLNTAAALAAGALSVVLIVLALSTDVVGAYRAVSRVVTVALMVVAVVLARRTAGSNVENRALTATGLILLVAAGLIDLFLAGPSGRPYTMPFAILLFVLAQSFVMIRRTAEATLQAQVSGRRLMREVEERTRELQAATASAQAANVAKTEFMNAVTHELRTPLTSIQGYIKLLREEGADSLSPQHVEFFEALEESAERLLNLVNKLLDLARIETGGIRLDLRPLDIAEVIEKVRSELYPLAKEKDLQLRIESPDERLFVVADEQWLSVVITDLVSNAIKYTSVGSVTVQTFRTARNGRNTVAIRVTDTGPGISEAFMPQLFERFSREGLGREDAPTGTGLGLTIVRQLVELMGGKVLVESRIGEGSSFIVLLPASNDAFPSESLHDET